MRALRRGCIRALGSLSLAGILSCATPSPPRATAPEAAAPPTAAPEATAPEATAPQATPPAPVALAPVHEPSPAAGVDGAATSGDVRTVVQTTGIVTEIAPNTYLITQPGPPPAATLDTSNVQRSAVRGTLQALDLPAHDLPPAGGSFPDLAPALDARLAALFRQSLARELRAAVARAAPAGFTPLDLRPLRHRCEREDERSAFLAHEVFRSLECLQRARTSTHDRSGHLVVREVLSVRALVVGGEHRSLGRHTMATARETRDVVLQLAIRWSIDSALRLREETVLLPHVLSVKPGPDHVQP
jgi:hypothetical protein